MKTEKAELEIKNLLDNGLSFQYDFDYNNVNKVNLSINKEGYSIKDIISKLKQGEKITFMLNDDDSIYWEHETYGDWVRVDSNMGSLQEWSKELTDKFCVKTIII